VLHAVADTGDTMRSLAEAIGGALAVPVEPASPDDFGFIGRVFALDMPSSSALTRERFSWEPGHPSLIADLTAGDYPALG
ncbi:3-beta hydroxysteroid dehydrogenase, partial [Streptomyces sp. NPDC058296]